MPEVEVAPGQELVLTARHDTYSISYSLPEEQAAAGAISRSTSSSADSTVVDAQAASAAASAVAIPSGPRRTNVPLVDPAWRTAYDRLQGLNSELVKSVVQNPLEFRAVAQAALQFAARPHDLELDAQQAMEFCVKLMG